MGRGSGDQAHASASNQALRAAITDRERPAGDQPAWVPAPPASAPEPAPATSTDPAGADRGRLNAEIVTLYQQGLSVREVADRLDVNARYVRRVTIEAGVPRRR